MFEATPFYKAVALIFAIGGGGGFSGGLAVHIAKPQLNGRHHHVGSVAHVSNANDEKDLCTVDGESRKIAFFHIPKTGTSLGTLIAHYINSSLPANAVIPNCQYEVCPHVTQPSLGQLEFQTRWRANIWFKNCFWMKPGHGPDGTDWLSHSQIPNDAYQMFEGRFVGLFRNPKQRALSSFYSFEHYRLKKYGIRSKEKWARLIEGTAVKMLAGQQFPIEAQATVDEGTVIVPNLEKAISRLDGFMFAGLVEHYELSVCLFHAITRTEWGPHDTENMRQRRLRPSEKWDETDLHGYFDPYDTPLYWEVQKRFWAALVAHGLTAEKCNSLCPGIDKSEFI
jgi:hypothetical protein